MVAGQQTDAGISMNTSNIPDSAYCIALQPICDAQLRHVADEMLYRSHAGASQAIIDNPVTSSARVWNTAFHEIGLEALVGQRDLYFNAPREWLLDPDLLPAGSEQLVIEVLENISVDQPLLESLQRLRTAGFRIALDDFCLDDQSRPLLAHADIVKLDMLQPGWENWLPEIRDHGVTLLAEKVEQPELFERCRDLGFSLFQGYFYARPQVQGDSQRKRASNHSAQIQLLSALYQETPDLQQLERLLVQDPQLCISLLRLSNSAAFRRSREISSIRQALQLLGTLRLRSLVLTLMLAQNGPASLLMLPNLLIRAAMCEDLAGSLTDADPHAAFTVGAFSMLDQLLDDDLPSLLQSASLSAEIRTAVLQQTGKLGKILKLVLTHEQGLANRLSASLLERVNHSYLVSASWANRLLGSL